MLFMLTRGKVKTYKIHDDGKEYITSLIKEGEYFGYLPIMEDKAYSDFALAMEDCEVCRVPKVDFIKLMEKNRDVANKFIKMISNVVMMQSSERRCLKSVSRDGSENDSLHSVLNLPDSLHVF